MRNTAEHQMHLNYRADIDGLRAVAVLSVVGFHAFPDLVKGGFIGVDIFFVISGFLISKIIFENLEKGTFSFLEFYARRVKRIFPALLFVLVSCFSFGWFTLSSDEYKQLGKHIAGGAGFVSNYIFWNEAGYFDTTAESKPLLHLWSLGIEEQFYIVWPLMLWAIWKRKVNLCYITIGIALISFTLNLVIVVEDVVATFYSPQTRFWELLCGSLLSQATFREKNIFPGINIKITIWPGKTVDLTKSEVSKQFLDNAQSFLGALLIAYGIHRVSKNSSFPGTWALLPTLGASSIISAGSHAWINRVILSNRLLVFIGLISFPLYLWHWPLLSFAKIIEGETSTEKIRVAAVAISIVLAWFTYRLIEKPVRFGMHGRVKTIWLCLLMAIVGYGGYYSYVKDGLPFRAYAEKLDFYTTTIKIPARQSECFEIPYAYRTEEKWFCELGNSVYKPAYFAYGDSHAASLLPALEVYANQNDKKILFTGTSGCPSLLGIQSMRGKEGIEKYNCEKLNERIFSYVKTNHIKNVILINRWTYYAGGTSRPYELVYLSRDMTKSTDKSTSIKNFEWALKNTISRYGEIGVKVFLVADNPQQIYEPKDALRKGRAVDADINKLSVLYKEHVENQAFANILLNQQNAQIINSDKLLCNENNCPLVRDGKFLYSDDDHLSIDGSMLIYPLLSEGLSK